MTLAFVQLSWGEQISRLLDGDVDASLARPPYDDTNGFDALAGARREAGGRSAGRQPTGRPGLTADRRSRRIPGRRRSGDRTRMDEVLGDRPAPGWTRRRLRRVGGDDGGGGLQRCRPGREHNDHRGIGRQSVPACRGHVSRSRRRWKLPGRAVHTDHRQPPGGQGSTSCCPRRGPGGRGRAHPDGRPAPVGSDHP